MAGQRKYAETTELRRRAPAVDPDEREKQLISMAVELTERKLRDGTAPTPLVIHYLKLATAKERLEQEKLKKEIALLEAKKNAADSAVRIEELYAGAISAITNYGSSINHENTDE